MKGSTLAKQQRDRHAPTSASCADASAGLSRDELVAAYRMMLLSRRLDDKEIQLKNQSLIFFQISGAGHEAVLVAAAAHLRAGYDWFYPYYRDRALCLGPRHDAARDAARRRRRQGRSELGRPADAVALGPPRAQHPVAGQPDRHAVPAGGRLRRSRHDLRARRRDRRRAERFQHADEITYVSIGDGATSEGEFWESLNTACTRPVPVLYLVEDNGYAISVPVEVQTPGRRHLAAGRELSRT